MTHQSLLFQIITTLKAEMSKVLCLVEYELMGEAMAEIRDSGAPQPRGESVHTNATQPIGSPNITLEEIRHGVVATGMEK